MAIGKLRLKTMQQLYSPRERKCFKNAGLECPPKLIRSTSTGLPKGVLSTQRQFLTNTRNVKQFLRVRRLWLTTITGYCRDESGTSASWG